jgi:molecular chaperone GrpE
MKKDSSPPKSKKKKEKTPSKSFSVIDRRFWIREEEEKDREPSLKQPTYVEKLEKELKQKDELLQKYIRQYKRVEQEFKEVKQRLQRETKREVEREKAKILCKIFEVLDNMELSLKSASCANSVQGIIEGLQMIYNQFKEVLLKLGIKSFGKQGDKFDPTFHEALSVKPVGNSKEDGTIVEVIKHGYQLGDQILRTATVIVGKSSLH